jgi:hypothetical protein
MTISEFSREVLLENIGVVVLQMRHLQEKSTQRMRIMDRVDR